MKVKNRRVVEISHVFSETFYALRKYNWTNNSDGPAGRQLVFMVDDSGDEVGRDVLEGCPLMLYLQVAPLLVCLDMAEQHQRRERHRDKPEEQDEGDAAEEEGQQEVGEETAKHVTLQKL